MKATASIAKFSLRLPSAKGAKYESQGQAVSEAKRVAPGSNVPNVKL